MNNTALRAGAQSANNTHMVFANEKHFSSVNMSISLSIKSRLNAPVYGGEPRSACAFRGRTEPQVEDIFRAGIPERGTYRDKGVW